MNRATVPKTAVYEHCHARSAEDQIRPHFVLSDCDELIYTVPSAGRVKSAPKCQLWASVGLAIASHYRTDACARGCGIGPRTTVNQDNFGVTLARCIGHNCSLSARDKT